MSGAFTEKLGETDSLCPTCIAESKEQKLEARIEHSSNGYAQMMVLFCPTHGPVKKLYSERPNAIFKALYPEFFKEIAQAEIVPEPTPTKWV